MSTVSANNSSKTTCVRGHELSGDNMRTYVSGGITRRSCVECKKIRKTSEHSVNKPKTLDENQKRRLIDAVNEGIPHREVRARFGIGWPMFFEIIRASK